MWGIVRIETRVQAEVQADVSSGSAFHDADAAMAWNNSLQMTTLPADKWLSRIVPERFLGQTGFTRADSFCILVSFRIRPRADPGGGP